MADFKLAFADLEKEFSVTHQGSTFHVQLDGRSADCRMIFQDGDYFVLELTEPDGTRRHIHAAGFAGGDNRQLWVDGQMISYRRVRRRSSAANLEGSLTATIPAIVTQVLVSVGDVVAAGEKLVLLESMKMVIPIQAPYDGTVAKICCQKGEAVQAGVQLIELSRKNGE